MHEVVNVKVSTHQFDPATVTAITATAPWMYQILSKDGCFEDSETGKWRKQGKKINDIQKRIRK